MITEFLHNHFFLFNTIFRKQKWSLVILGVLGFTNGLFDSISIGMMIPMIALLTGGEVAEDSTVVQALERGLAFFHIGIKFRSLFILMVLLFLAKAVGELVLGYIRMHIAQKYEHDMRIGLYKKVLDARWPHLMHQKIGYLENVLMVDVKSSTGLLSRLGVTLPTMASLVVYMAAALAISFWVTIITVVSGFLLLVMLRPIHMRVGRYTGKIVQINKTLAHRINEIIQGMKTIKAMRLEGDVLKKETPTFENLRDTMLKSTMVKLMSTAIIEPASMFVIFGVFAFSYSRPGFNLGNFVAVIYLIQRIYNQIKKMQGGILAVSESMPYINHLLKLQEGLIANEETDTGTKPFQFQRELAFREIVFAYGPDSKVFSGLSWQIKKNEMVGIIGPSGAGKTTTVDLILRLFEPQGGTISIDGVPSTEFRLNELRRNIGYVSQDIFLENDTIEQNIKFYRDYITDEDMVKAAKDAGIYEFISGLPKGFQSMIGERGILLSGGQRQRVILARILAQHPQILILDEATSSLDNESEAVVRQSLENLKGKVTVIVIAHRLSTVMHLDRLLALNHGRIIEEGTPQELLHNPQSYFYKVYQLALAGEHNKTKDHLF